MEFQLAKCAWCDKIRYLMDNGLCGVCDEHDLARDIQAKKLRRERIINRQKEEV